MHLTPEDKFNMNFQGHKIKWSLISAQGSEFLPHFSIILRHQIKAEEAVCIFTSVTYFEIHSYVVMIYTGLVEVL